MILTLIINTNDTNSSFTFFFILLYYLYNIILILLNANYLFLFKYKQYSTLTLLLLTDCFLPLLFFSLHLFFTFSLLLLRRYVYINAINCVLFLLLHSFFETYL